MAYRVVSIFLYAIRSGEKKIVKVYGLVHTSGMRRSGGPLDQPGGCSFKTYVRVQKLRAAAELCLTFEPGSSEQVIGNNAVTRKYVRKNIFFEFFKVGRNRCNGVAAHSVGEDLSGGPVSGKLIHGISRFFHGSGNAEVGK